MVIPVNKDIPDPRFNGRDDDNHTLNGSLAPWLITQTTDTGSTNLGNEDAVRMMNENRQAILRYILDEAIQLCDTALVGTTITTSTPINESNAEIASPYTESTTSDHFEPSSEDQCSDDGSTSTKVQQEPKQ